jgi:DNA-binding CsgD family transcriptional regulator
LAGRLPVNRAPTGHVFALRLIPRRSIFAEGVVSFHGATFSSVVFSSAGLDCASENVDMVTSATMVMQKPTEPAAASPEGFLLLDSTLNPIFVNQAAAKILLYPHDVEKQRKLSDLLAGKISALFSGQASGRRAPVNKFQSGKRLYLCRSFRANALADSRPLVAVLLERGSVGSISLIQVSERFHLTTREQEVLQYLSEGGLTSKEIAMRMRISPNTVKAFLRLIMLKMGVSTRSGIVGKAMATKF